MEYHFRRKASPRMTKGPAGGGMSKPENAEMQDPCTSRMYSMAEMVKLWPVRVKVRSGSELRFSHSIVYCPFQLFLAPISALLRNELAHILERRHD